MTIISLLIVQELHRSRSQHGNIIITVIQTAPSPIAMHITIGINTIYYKAMGLFRKTIDSTIALTIVGRINDRPTGCQFILYHLHPFGCRLIEFFARAPFHDTARHIEISLQISAVKTVIFIQSNKRRTG